MKSILLLVLLTFVTGKEPITELFGKWKLEKIESHGKTITPEKTSYFLNISEKSIKYNTPINTCWSDSFFVDKKSIELYDTRCTEIAEQIDSINKNLNYSGTYELKDSNLIIVSSKGTLYLKKIN